MQDKIEGVRRSCRVASSVMAAAATAVAAGHTTGDIGAVIESAMALTGGRSAFLGYHGFPGIACISVNEEVLHGIPSKSRMISPGDIVKVDLGMVLDNLYSDMACTFLIDDGSEKSVKHRKLSNATLTALMAGIAVAKAGNTTRDIGKAIEASLASSGYRAVEGMSGHGVGYRLHEPPAVPNYVDPKDGMFTLSAGMTIAIEPMVGAGSSKVMVKNDGWTIVMADGEPAAHFEHTVLITDGEPEILTRF